MKDARTPETPGVPQTGDDHWKPILLFVLLGASAAGLMATMIYKKKHGKTEKADETKKEEQAVDSAGDVVCHLQNECSVALL